MAIRPAQLKLLWHVFHYLEQKGTIRVLVIIVSDYASTLAARRVWTSTMIMTTVAGTSEVVPEQAVLAGLQAPSMLLPAAETIPTIFREITVTSDSLTPWGIVITAADRASTFSIAKSLISRYVHSSPLSAPGFVSLRGRLLVHFWTCLLKGGFPCLVKWKATSASSR
jgi:hypothetical protein